MQYFILILLLLIGLAVGAFLAFSGKMEKLKEPFFEALKQYNDQSAVSTEKALVEAWDNFQLDVSYCSYSQFLLFLLLLLLLLLLFQSSFYTVQ